MSDLSKGTILVTGGAGFIGSALVWHLNQLGHDDILISDRLGTDEKWRNLVALKYRDYIDANALISKVQKKNSESLGDISTIFHLGACSATTEKDAGFLMENNFGYTRELAHWAVERGARFVYASSAATYGDGSMGMDDEENDIERLRPLNMYGYSKQLFDTYAKRKGMLNGIVGLKYFNVFGPNEDHKGDMRSLVHKAYAQIRETGKLALFKSYHPDYADGEQMRDFLYVKDAVAMTVHLAGNDDAGGLYNLGSGEANTWKYLAEGIFAALEMTPNIEFIDMPDVLKNKYQYYTKAEISKIRGAGYDADITALHDSLRDYVRNYLMLDRRLGDEALPTSEQYA